MGVACWEMRNENVSCFEMENKLNENDGKNSTRPKRTLIWQAEKPL